MTEYTPPAQTIVQLFDRMVVQEYIKVNKGLIFSSEEIVRADCMERELILKIDTEIPPTKIILNGKVL